VAATADWAAARADVALRLFRAERLGAWSRDPFCYLAPGYRGILFLNSMLGRIPKAETALLQRLRCAHGRLSESARVCVYVCVSVCVCACAYAKITSLRLSVVMGRRVRAFVRALKHGTANLTSPSLYLSHSALKYCAGTHTIRENECVCVCVCVPVYLTVSICVCLYMST
jgi:hypothetical protein